ncbi:unnamed protein product [Symbiodinium sp. CCMP2456]|nr:unnamed protein product [Symbiodinium sp. CCMP2456]
MGDEATSTTSLELVNCFVCDLKQRRYRLLCDTPSCQRYRGKIYLCSSCGVFCPKCSIRLHANNLSTASGPPTLQTWSSLQSKGKEESAKGQAQGGQGYSGKGQKGVESFRKGGGKTSPSKGKQWRPVGNQIVERTISVAGYAIGTVLGQNRAQLKEVRSSYPGLHISETKKDKEETFVGPRAHEMELVIRGHDVEMVDEAVRTFQMLIDRAGASHKPPHSKNTLIDVSSASCAKLVPADIKKFHVCPIQLQQTAAGGSGRRFFVLEKVPFDSSLAGDSVSAYSYCPDHFDWSALHLDFQRCLDTVAPEKLSEARVSARFGKLFFWGPTLSRETAQRPGAIDQLSYRDCRPQWAARLKRPVAEELSEVLKMSDFMLSQQLTNTTHYIKTEEDGAKMEVTFFDPQCSVARATEMTRLWSCTSHLEVLKIDCQEQASSGRVALARRMLELLLHPSHNEFEGCWCAMDIIKRAADDLLSKIEFRPPDMPLDQALRIRAPYREAGGSEPKPGGVQTFVAKKESERLFRGDVCRLGHSPDFRLTVNASAEVNIAQGLADALHRFDVECRGRLQDPDELVESFHKCSLPFGWKLQCVACREECVWMDNEQAVEVGVSKIREVTCLSKPGGHSGESNYEIRFSSEPASKAVRGRHADAWEHASQLLSTVQMLHESLKLS